MILLRKQKNCALEAAYRLLFRILGDMAFSFMFVWKPKKKGKPNNSDCDNFNQKKKQLPFINFTFAGVPIKLEFSQLNIHIICTSSSIVLKLNPDSRYVERCCKRKRGRKVCAPKCIWATEAC